MGTGGCKDRKSVCLCKQGRVSRSSELKKVLVEISESKFQNGLIVDLVYTPSELHVRWDSVLREGRHCNILICLTHEGFTLPLCRYPIYKGKVFPLCPFFLPHSRFGFIYVLDRVV